jgi:hypothetical protein
MLKTFFFVTNEKAKKRTFVTGRPFDPGLIGLEPFQEDARDKHYSLFCPYVIGDEGKKFYNTDTRSCCRS